MNLVDIEIRNGGCLEPEGCIDIIYYTAEEFIRRYLNALEIVTCNLTDGGSSRD